MKTLANIVGTIVLVLYVLSWLGLVDFYLCVGKRGACIATKASQRLPTSERSTQFNPVIKLRQRDREPTRDVHDLQRVAPVRPGFVFLLLHRSTPVSVPRLGTIEFENNPPSWRAA